MSTAPRDQQQFPVRAPAPRQNGGGAPPAAPPANRMSLANVQRGRIARPPRVLMYGPPGIGKAQPLDAQILTPRGFRAMGDLAAGDQVVGGDGKPTEVLGIYPQGRRPVFRVEMSDGVSTECCIEHLWQTHTVDDAKAGRPSQIRALAQIAETLTRAYESARDGECITPQHRVPVVAPVEFAASAALPLDPYVMGVILGDGSIPKDQRSVTIYKPEADIHMRVAARLPAGDEVRPMADGSGVRICRIGVERGGADKEASRTREFIEDLALAGCDATEKFIPDCYLRGSPAERIDLLRGLCDTDGHVIASGARVEYSTSSPKMAADVEDLVRGLGGTVRVETRTPHYSYRGERRTGAPSWRMTIYFPDGAVPVASDKHRAKWRAEGRRYYRTIVAVEPVGEKECQCIRVSAADGLYVTDGYIVTHNTTWAAGAPDVILLPVESGSDNIDVARLPQPATFDEVFGVIRELAQAEHQYKTFALDTVDALEALIWRHVCRRAEVETIEEVGGGYGKGYTESLDHWRRLLKGLELLRDRGMIVVLIGHADVRTWKSPLSPDFDRYQLRLNQKAAAVVIDWSDDVLFAHLDVQIAKQGQGKWAKAKAVGGTRVVRTQSSPAYEAKNRHNLPARLPLDFGDYFAAVQQAQPAPASTAEKAIATMVEALGDKTIADWVTAQLKGKPTPALLAKIRDRLAAKLEEKEQLEQEARDAAGEAIEPAADAASEREPGADDAQ